MNETLSNQTLQIAAHSVTHDMVSYNDHWSKLIRPSKQINKFIAIHIRIITAAFFYFLKTYCAT
jgi:hypothetical protein